MPSKTYPGAPGAPALPAAHAVVGTVSTSLHISPQGYQVVAHWSFGFSARTLRTAWLPSPAAAWVALGPLIAPYLNGSAMNHVTPVTYDA